MDRRDLFWVTPILVLLLATYGVMFFLFHRWNVFSGGTPTNSPLLLAAVIGLAGTTASGVLALIGIAIKTSVERDREDRKKQAQETINVDVSIRAAQLLGGDSDSQARHAAALIALTNLGQLRFALGLLSELWPKKEIGTSNALILISEAIDSGDASLQNNAMNELAANAVQLANRDDVLQLPRQFADDWVISISFGARVDLLAAVLKALMSKGYRDWNDEVLNGIIYLCYKAAVSDPDPGLANSAASLTSLLLIRHFPGGPTDKSLPDRENISFAQMAREVDEIIARITGETKLVPRIALLTMKLRSWPD